MNIPVHTIPSANTRFRAPGGIGIKKNADHDDRLEGGADLVSQDPSRGGISKPMLRFRTYNSSPDGMTITDTLGRHNPAPKAIELPNEEFEGKVLVSGLPPVPKMVNPPTQGVQEPARQSALAEVHHRVAQPSALIAPAAGTIKIIGELQDIEIPCLASELTPDNAWLTIVSPIGVNLKLKPDQDLTIETPMGTGRFWFTGIAMQLPFAGAVVRVFGLSEDKTASQEEAAAVS